MGRGRAPPQLFAISSDSPSPADRNGNSGPNGRPMVDGEELSSWQVEALERAAQTRSSTCPSPSPKKWSPTTRRAFREVARGYGLGLGISFLLGLVLLCVGLGFYVHELQMESEYVTLSSCSITSYREQDYVCGTDVPEICTNYFYGLGYVFPDSVDVHPGKVCTASEPGPLIGAPLIGANTTENMLDIVPECEAAAVKAGAKGYVVKGGLQREGTNCDICSRTELKGATTAPTYTMIFNDTKQAATTALELPPQKQTRYNIELMNPRIPKGRIYSDRVGDMVECHVHPLNPEKDPRFAFPDSFVPGMQLIIAGCVFVFLPVIGVPILFWWVQA